MGLIRGSTGPKRWGFWVVTVLWFAASVDGSAQSLLPVPSPTVASVEARLAEIDNSNGPEAATVRELYRQTLMELEAAAGWQATALDLETRIQAAPGALAETAAALAAPAPDDVVLEAGTPLGDAEQRLAQGERDLATATARLIALDTEPLRRTSRRGVIRQRLAQLATDGAAVASDAGDATARARSTLLAAQAFRRANETAALEQELLAYDAEALLLPRQRDLAALETGRLQRWVQALRQDVMALQREDASRQADAARSEASGVYSRQLTEFVRTNAALADRRVTLLDLAEQLRRRRTALVAERDQLAERNIRTRARVEAIGQVPAVGLLLRNQRETLPDIRRYRRQIAADETASRIVQAELFDLDDQRGQLANLDTAVDGVIDTLGLFLDTPDDYLEALANIRRVLENQRAYLDALLGDLGQHFDVLVEVAIVQRQIVSETEAFTEFVAERILWTRSAERLGLADVVSATSALSGLLSSATWSGLAATVVTDLRGHALAYGLVLGLLAGASSQRRRVIRGIMAAGKIARLGATDRYGPTVAAAMLTVTVAAGVPGVLWFVARRLGQLPGDEFAFAASRGLLAVAATWVPLELLRQAARPTGLMTAHFGWTAGPVELIRHHLRWALPVALPLVWLVAVSFGHDNAAQQDSLGRFALIALLILFSVVVQRLLHPARGVFRKVLIAHPAGWLNRLRGVWYGGAVAAPLIIAGIAAIGYVYTAIQLMERALGTLWLAVGLAIAHGLMVRWVLVNRRRLVMVQRSGRLDTAATETATDGPVPDTHVPDLIVLNAQTRQFVRTATAVTAGVAGWVVWADVIPALGVFDRVTLWTLAGEEAGTAVRFTLEDLALTLFLSGMTAIVAKTVPAVLEMSLLQRLPLQAGLRYAITTITRYVLGFIGLAVIVGVLGVTWDSVQWLVAAFGVGLGFGLQEIFANFVSGIILLFERPVRVGDTVTIGETSGTVMKIRMRATTILGWDRKELIVPNKDLVTGQLVNWTLSDASQRITVTVGVAYGSDVDRVTCVLQEILRDNALVLPLPEPTTTFGAFGDSALTFSLRAYLATVEDRLPAIHGLHVDIARRFQQEGIEIAFPQLDVHLRSTDAAELPESAGGSDGTSRVEPRKH